eukprot:715060_1
MCARMNVDEFDCLMHSIMAWMAWCRTAMLVYSIRFVVPYARLKLPKILYYIQSNGLNGQGGRPSEEENYQKKDREEDHKKQWKATKELPKKEAPKGVKSRGRAIKELPKASKQEEE